MVHLLWSSKTESHNNRHEPAERGAFSARPISPVEDSRERSGGLYCISSRGRFSNDGPVTELTLRIELFPTQMDPFVDFYTRVLRFRLVRDERDATFPYVSVERGSV